MLNVENNPFIMGVVILSVVVPSVVMLNVVAPFYQSLWQKMKPLPRKPYRRERNTTVDLLAKITCFVKR